MKKMVDHAMGIALKLNTIIVESVLQVRRIIVNDVKGFSIS